MESEEQDKTIRPEGNDVVATEMTEATEAREVPADVAGVKNDEAPKTKKQSFRKRSKILIAILAVVLVAMVIGLVVWNMNGRNGGDQFIYIGEQGNLPLGDSSYVFTSYKDYMAKTMGVGGLEKEDFETANYGLISVEDDLCEGGTVEPTGVWLKDNGPAGNIEVEVRYNGDCGCAKTYKSYLFPVDKGAKNPKILIQYVNRKLCDLQS